MAGGRKTANARKRSSLFPHFGDLNFWIAAVFMSAIFLRPLFSGVAYPWSNTYFQIVVLGCSCALGFRVISGREMFYRHPAALPLVCFLIWTGVSTYFSVHGGASLRELYNVLGYVLTFFLAVNVFRSARRKAAAVEALVYSSLIVSLYAVYQYFWGLERTRLYVDLYHAGEFVPEFISRLGTQRAFSTFVYPPALAGFLTVVIPAGLGIMLGEENTAKKWLLALSVFLCAFALVLTYSKGGWLTAAASCLFFVFIWMRRVRGGFHRGAAAGLALMAAVFAAVVFSGVERRATAKAFLASYAVRQEYWRAAPGILSESPFTGSGPGTWGSVYPRHKLLEAEETQMAHNNYVQVAAEGGIPAAVFFLWFFTAVAAQGAASLKKDRAPAREKLLNAGLAAGIAAFLFQSLGEFTFYIPGVSAAVFLFAGLTGDEGGKGEYATLPGRGRLLLYAAAAAAAIVLLFVLRKPMEGDRHYEAAVRRLEKGDAAGAEVLFSRAIEAFPAEARYYYHKGMMYESLPAFLDEAIAMYKEAAARNRASASIHSRLAHACWKKSGGEDNIFREKAVENMEKAVSFYPFAALYRVSLGRMYHLSGRESEALAEYKKAVEYKKGERMSARREVLREQLDNVEKWILEIESGL